MTKKELVAAVARRTGFTRETVQVLLNAVLDEIHEQLVSGKSVTIPKFGKFMVRSRKGRTGRNPRTGKPISIRSSQTVAFKAGTRLRSGINEPGRF